MSNVKQEGSFKIKETKTTDSSSVKKEDGIVKVTIKDDYQEQKPSNEPIKVTIPSEAPEAVSEVTEEKEEQEVVMVGETQQEAQAEGLVEIQEDEIKQEPAEAVDNTTTTEAPNQRQLPENIEKLVSFMEETGGSVEDYVRLNADYNSIDDKTLLREYYRKTKPYLDNEDINLILEDYDYDKDLDEDRDIRKKKIAFKEEVTKAKSFLEKTKSKYYDEIKLRPGVTQEQQKATEFFNRYQEDQRIAEQQHSDFKSKTNDYFTNEFKGFDFNVGKKKFRYGLQDPNKVAENQSSINNFVGKFLDESGNIKDTKGYHKAIYIASNADKIINHFYEQGRTDATKEIVNSSKNPSTEPRQTGTGEFVNGIKVKSISGYDSSKLRIKTKKFN